MDTKEQAIATTFAFTHAFVALCKAFESARVITRSQVAEAIQEQLLRASVDEGRSEEFLRPLRSLAVHLAPVPGVPPA